MQKIIIGNWKMNGSLADNAQLLAAIGQELAVMPAPLACTVAVAPPVPYLAQVQQLLASTAVQLAAQDVSQHAKGAYTGEASAAMLREFGVRYVLVGHSERRQYHGERDAAVAAKALAALDTGLVPVVCLGETLAEREAGDTNRVVQAQLDAVLVALGARASDVILAYEPVWAIGTGRTATPEQAQAVHAVLRARLIEHLGENAAQVVPILYGGSMNAANAAQLLAQQDVDGGLIGGASLKATDFLQIVQTAIAVK